MDSDHVLVLFLGLALVGAAVALAYSSPAVFGGQSDGIGGATLDSFETTDAYCGDPNSTSGSTFTRDVRGGEALVLNQSVPVASNDTTVSASLDEIGPQRYVLAITREPPERTPTATPTPTPDTATPTPTPANDTGGPTTNGTGGNGTANESENATTGTNETVTEQATTAGGDTPTPTPAATGPTCHPEVRYNATIRIGHPDEYTVVVTYDDEFVTAYWSDGDDSGSYDTLPAQPETANGQNETAATVRSSRPTA